MSLQDKTKAEILERYRVAEQQNELMRDELAHLRAQAVNVAAERERSAMWADHFERECLAEILYQNLTECSCRECSEQRSMAKVARGIAAKIRSGEANNK